MIQAFALQRLSGKKKSLVKNRKEKSNEN